MLTQLTKLTRAQKRAVLLITDALCVAPACWMALWLRAAPETALEAPILAPTMLAAVLGSLALGIANIRISAFEERAAGKSLMLSFGLGVVSWAVAAATEHPFAPGLAILLAVCHFSLVLGSRWMMSVLLHRAYAHGAPIRRILIYGAGQVGLQALQALKSHPTLQPIGFIDDAPSLRGLMISGVHVYPPIQLGALVARLGAQEVLIARPDLSPADRARLADVLEGAGLRVASLPTFAELAGPDLSAPSALATLTRPPPVQSTAVYTAYRGKVVVVTGAGGSIGSELAHQVLKLAPARLILVEQCEYALYRIDGLLRPMAEAAGIALDLVLGSAGDPVLMRRVLSSAGADVILHAAAYKHVPLVEANPAAALANNVLCTECLARLAAELGIPRFVLVSTDKAVRPRGTMGLSKWMAEQVVRDLGRRHAQLQVSVVRFGNVLGSSGSVLPRFQEQVRTGGPVTVTDPRMERYFMSVEEAVHLVLEAGAMSDQSQTLFFDMGPPIRIEDLARQVIQAAGYSVRDADRPEGDIPLRFTGMRPGEKLTEDLTVSGRAVPTAHPRIFIAPDPVLSEFEVAQLLRDVRQAVDQGRSLDPNRFVAFASDNAALAKQSMR